MHRRHLLIVPSVALLLFGASAPAHAAGEPEIASGELTIPLEGGDAAKLGLDKDREYGPTTATVLLRNPSTKVATVKLWAWLDDGQPIAITRVKDEKGTAIDRAIDPMATPSMVSAERNLFAATASIDIRANSKAVMALPSPA